MSTPDPASTWLVVPCFNEERRLDGSGLAELARATGAQILLVDDGSTDATAAMASRFVEACPDRFALVVRPVNGGKGEAVRHGLLEALARGATTVGYCDADMATPPSEMARLVQMAHRDGVEAVLGSRVALLGSGIRRSARRHYLGRVFATASSMALQMTVYDTQCGAKVFRVVPALRAALSTPFRSRWAFDVELIGRLRYGTATVPGLDESAFREVPITGWCDRGDSRLGAMGAVRAAMDLACIAASARR